MSKVLGIDYGSSKVGLALADLETKVAVPLEAVEPNQLNDKISELIESEGLEKIVVGLPLNMAGKESNQTKEVNVYFIISRVISFCIQCRMFHEGIRYRWLLLQSGKRFTQRQRP